MKNKFYFLVVLLFLFTRIVLSQQSGWFWQNPLPQGDRLFNIYMFDANNGISIDYNNIIQTTNGGENWHIINNGSYADYIRSSFINQNTGYIILSNNDLVSSNNGGVSWNYVSHIDTFNFLHAFLFINNNVGIIISNDIYDYQYGTMLYRTTNGGLNWDLRLEDTNYILASICFPS